jgi:hypothetical protein
MKGPKIYLPRLTMRKGEAMQTPEAVAAMQRLYKLVLCHQLNDGYNFLSLGVTQLDI